MNRTYLELHKVLLGRALVVGFGLLFAPVVQPCVAQDAAAVSKSVSSQAIAAIKSMPGISVQEKDGEVIGVDFRKCGDDWIKTFPKILEIPSVQIVSVSGPSATHELIVSLKSLPNLKTLRMEQSSITDQTIAEVAKFPKVDDLLLDRCGITDECLKSLGQSKTIKRIRAPRTKLSDAGLAYLKDTVQLELLDLSDCNQISDEGLSHLKGKLKEFDIFRTRVGNDALAAISGAKEMSKMKLRDCAITTKGIVEHIGKFPNLTALDLSETTIKDAALAEIGKLEKLEDLNLWHTRVTDEGLRSLTSSKLKRLNLDDTNIGDGAIEHLSKIEGLEFLHIGKTAVTDEKIGELAKLKNLKDLILTNTTLSKKAVASLQEKLPKTNIKY